MKSYNGLMNKVLDRTEAVTAIEEAAKYKRHRPTVMRILENKEAKAEEVCRKLERGEWHPPHHEKQVLYEGSHRKAREIVKPRFDDEQIVHHMLMRPLRPIISKRLYRYAYGSLPRRGSHAAVEVMKRWRNGYGNRRFYVLECDVRHFYDSIDTELLKAKLDKLIRDERYKVLLFSVIDAGSPGLPKGFYPSPWLANFYMMEPDCYITQELKPDHYLRYMDNMFLFCANRRKLHRIRRALAEYLERELHLQLKGDWQVFRFEKKSSNGERVKGRAINALGYVIHRDRVGVRKSSLQRVRRKANRIHAKGRCTLRDAQSMVSRAGLLRHANAYGYYRKYIKPKVSIHYCKRKISAHMKKQKGAKTA